MRSIKSQVNQLERLKAINQAGTKALDDAIKNNTPIVVRIFQKRKRR